MLLDRTRVKDFELVFGFVCPLGVNVDAASLALSEALHDFDYTSTEIRLSGFLQTASQDIEAKMDDGDRLRAMSGHGDILAGRAVAEILSRRGDDRKVRKAWVVRTLKHDDEVDLLREVFGSRFVLIALNQSLDSRTQYVLNALRDASPGASDLQVKVTQLIQRDQLDQSNKYGQRVSEAFTRADFYVDVDDSVHDAMDRVVGLLFGQPYITPSRDEQSMFHAHAASLRSSDAGRQVGAVVASTDGDILAIGANEVPKAGGGEFWENDSPDLRDFKLGYDPNRRQIGRVLHELLDALAVSGHLAEDLLRLSSEDRFNEIWRSSRPELRSARALALIEFGRVVHAEMSALMLAVRLGRPLRGATIYVTAFPCHMCMRLIIASGIQRVVYVDPYPKSLASDMYGASLSDRADISGRVLTEAFVGVGWNMFGDVFTAINRTKKSDGSMEPFVKSEAIFRVAGADPLLESQALENQTALLFAEAMKKVQNQEGSSNGQSGQSRRQRIPRGMARHGRSLGGRKIRRPPAR